MPPKTKSTWRRSSRTGVLDETQDKGLRRLQKAVKSAARDKWIAHRGWPDDSTYAQREEAWGRIHAREATKRRLRKEAAARKEAALAANTPSESESYSVVPAWLAKLWGGKRTRRVKRGRVHKPRRRGTKRRAMKGRAKMRRSARRRDR